MFVVLLLLLIAAKVRTYRITIDFGLNANGCGLVILSTQAPRPFASRICASLPTWQQLVLVGTISYGLYLWQEPFFTSLNIAVSGRFALILVAALMCAIASFIWIGRPALRAMEFFNRSSL